MSVKVGVFPVVEACASIADEEKPPKPILDVQ